VGGRGYKIKFPLPFREGARGRAIKTPPPYALPRNGGGIKIGCTRLLSLIKFPLPFREGARGRVIKNFPHPTPSPEMGEGIKIRSSPKWGRPLN